MTEFFTPTPLRIFWHDDEEDRYNWPEPLQKVPESIGDKVVTTDGRQVTIIALGCSMEYDDGDWIYGPVMYGVRVKGGRKNYLIDADRIARGTTGGVS